MNKQICFFCRNYSSLQKTNSLISFWENLRCTNLLYDEIIYYVHRLLKVENLQMVNMHLKANEYKATFLYVDTRVKICFQTYLPFLKLFWHLMFRKTLQVLQVFPSVLQKRRKLVFQFGTLYFNLQQLISVNSHSSSAEYSEIGKEK